jgi:hypothetical protein
MSIIQQVVAPKNNTLNYVKEFVKSIDGIFVDYTSDKFAVIIPLQASKRIQRVFGIITRKKDKLEFNSIVCTKDKADFERLSEEQKEFTYSKFIKEGDNVMISASINMETANYYLIQDVIMEVAKNADDWEKKLTGMDIY